MSPTQPAPTGAPVAGPLPDRDARRVIPFTRWRRAGFATSVALLLLTCLSLALHGLNLGIDFTGGTVVEARLAAPEPLEQLRQRLAGAGFAESVVQTLDDGATVLIRLKSSDVGAPAKLQEALGAGTEIRSQAVIGPKVSSGLLRSGVEASLLAVGVIAVYVWLRFEARFGLSALLTTLHDVVMMVGFFSVTGLSFDLTAIAALLLIAGYSINDTVVVFDRLRETLGRQRDMALTEAIDRSVTSTLRRTLMTSGSTLATSVSLMIFGGPVLFPFATAVTFGICAGTLSSIFVAAPMLLHLPGRLPGRDPDPDPAPAPEPDPIPDPVPDPREPRDLRP
ncbi:protein translocase subunit SecF [Aquicoccus sp. SCR17]|nr:protein translocase subunit SecF [Carideicomes alvinocaridis]